MNFQYPKYSAQFVIDNFYGGSEMWFEYHGVTYFLCFTYKNKDSDWNIFVKKHFTHQEIIKEREEYYCISEIEPNSGQCINTQYFNNMRELFDNAIIEGKKLKDIWDDVGIEQILGFDKY